MSRTRKGLLVTIEGIDGAGKSTLLRELGPSLSSAGFKNTLVSEPSEGFYGKLARSTAARDPVVGALLFTLDRKETRPELEQLLRRNDVVLQDRSFYSTLAYQGAVLSPAMRQALDVLEREVARAPDLVLLLHGPVTVALGRIRGRARKREPLEKERLLRAVQHRYLLLAKAEKRLFRKISFDQPADEMLREALSAIRDKLGSSG
ncbi:MAG: dTMP kinase [Candidatus Thermoplasmatota archaeon]|jgi:dTMP kinase|nr:dTMP kinase [Candidatus Thermoplasmatota archaeon]